MEIKIKKHDIKLGSDPEIFIEKDGEIVSAVGMIPGTKRDPHPITNKGHFIQTDNIAFEFNIPACETAEEYVENINFVKEHLEVLANANGCKLSTIVSAEINPIHLQTRQAKEFGCEPDLNVYLQDLNPKPDSNTNLRCVGGHVHIGYPNPDFEVSERIVKMFDIMVTLPSLLIDKDDRRRELYGKPGSFRQKDFGVECRALSNFWIHSDELIAWVFNQTIKAVEIVLDNQDDVYINKFSEEVREAIESNNRDLAKILIENIAEVSQTKLEFA
jgi:hypothetical protein